MRTATKTYQVYKFDELSKQTQTLVINKHVENLLYEDREFLSDNVKRAIKDAEAMRTPWLTGQYIYEYAKDEIMSSVRENEYLATGEFYLPITE